MWQKGKDFLVKIALVISPLEATQRRTDFVCRTCRRRCAKRRLRRLLAAADHASGLPRATTLRVDLRLPSTPSPLVMTCFSAQSLGRLFASPAQVVGAAQHSDDVTCSWPAHPRGPARPGLTRPPPPSRIRLTGRMMAHSARAQRSRAEETAARPLTSSYCYLATRPLLGRIARIVILL